MQASNRRANLLILDLSMIWGAAFGLIGLFYVNNPADAATIITVVAAFLLSVNLIRSVVDVAPLAGGSRNVGNDSLRSV